MSAAIVKKNRESALKDARWWKEVSWCRIITILMIIYCLIPLLYVLSVSLNPGATFTGLNKLFSKVSFENFAALGSGRYSAYQSWVLNSLIASSATTVDTVLMDVAAAYMFSRFRFKGHRVILTGPLLVQMFPQMLTSMILSLLLLDIEDIFPVLSLDSKLGPICVYLGGTLGSNTFLFHGFFSSISRSLDEMTTIGGVTYAQTFWTIIIPLVRPILTIVGLLSPIPSLDGFVIACVVLQNPRRLMLVVGIHNWAAGARTVPWGIFAANSVIVAVPATLLFQYPQKYIVSGLTADDVKE